MRGLKIGKTSSFWGEAKRVNSNMNSVKQKAVALVGMLDFLP
jgi:hypothetical protein